MRKGPTIASRIACARTPTSGFDYLRLALAASVLFWHSYVVAHGHDAGAAYQASLSGAVLRLILPMFFSLSGFLVASSLERATSLPLFLSFRVLRILPALAVEVTLSAMIIGPLVTIDSPTQYFSDPLFVTYFRNLFGNIQYRLPGVFIDNPWSSTVNASLWTVPYELECYIALVVIYYLGFTNRPIVMGALTALLSLSFLLLFRKESLAELAIDPVPGRMLVICFLAGVFIYAARSLIPYTTPFFASCAGMSVILLSWPTLQFLAALPAAYVTVWLGLRDPPRNRFLLSGDYSYGIYLYGFVVQQCLMRLSRGWIESTLPLFLCALVGTSLLAAFSWHVIEAPVLRFKRHLSARARDQQLRRDAIVPLAMLNPDRHPL